MRTETVTYEIFTFAELTPETQQCVIERNYDFDVFHDWWEFVYEDAKRIGLKITSFDINRAQSIEGELTLNVADCIKATRLEHGENCDTHTPCDDYDIKYKKCVVAQCQDEANQLYYTFANEVFLDELETEEINREFKHALLQEYLSILSKEYEYLTSEEHIRERLTEHEGEYLVNGEEY